MCAWVSETERESREFQTLTSENTHRAQIARDPPFFFTAKTATASRADEAGLRHVSRGDGHVVPAHDRTCGGGH